MVPRKSRAGVDLTREAARLCAPLDLHFIGYVEGFHLFEDGVDVVVTDWLYPQCGAESCRKSWLCHDAPAKR